MSSGELTERSQQNTELRLQRKLINSVGIMTVFLYICYLILAELKAMVYLEFIHYVKWYIRLIRSIMEYGTAVKIH